MDLITLIGILIIIIGFTLKLDTLSVVIVAALATGLSAGMDFIEVLRSLGKYFVNARSVSLFFLTLATVGILERNGLRETASRGISKIKKATAGMVFSIYTLARIIAGALSIRLSGHIQFIRPLIYPMGKVAAESVEGHSLSVDEDDKLKSLASASDNYGNFFGQNLFIASPGVIMIVKTLNDLNDSAGGKFATINADKVVLMGLPIAIFAMIFMVVQGYFFDRKIKYSSKIS